MTLHIKLPALQILVVDEVKQLKVDPGIEILYKHQVSYAENKVCE